MRNILYKIFALGLLTTTIVLAWCWDDTNNTTSRLPWNSTLTWSTWWVVTTWTTWTVNPNPNPWAISWDYDNDGIYDGVTWDDMMSSGMSDTTGQNLTWMGMTGTTTWMNTTWTNKTWNNLRSWVNNSWSNQSWFNRQESYDVNIQWFAFKPQVLRIKKWDIVTWTNQDTVWHTATTTVVPTNNKGFDSWILQKWESYSYTFNQTWTYNYICTPHPRMTWEIIVE